MALVYFTKIIDKHTTKKVIMKSTMEFFLNGATLLLKSANPGNLINY